MVEHVILAFSLIWDNFNILVWICKFIFFFYQEVLVPDDKDWFITAKY